MQRLLALMSCVVLSFASAQAQENYPSWPITLVVASTGGSFPDALARAFSRRLEDILGASIVVENKTGGAGILAAQRMLQAGPDGYTLLIGDQQIWAITPATQPNVPCNPATDLVAISIVAISPMFLVANSSFPANNLADAVALIRANPDKYNYSWAGVGGVHQLATEMFKAREGAKCLLGQGLREKRSNV